MSSEIIVIFGIIAGALVFITIIIADSDSKFFTNIVQNRHEQKVLKFEEKKREQEIRLSEIENEKLRLKKLPNVPEDKPNIWPPN